MSHAESNTKSSISVSVHGPVVAGSDTGGCSYYSSSHLSDDKFDSITDIETRSFHDAGDMRGETECGRSHVNSCLTETSEAPETMNFKGSQGSEMHRSSTSAQLDGSNDRRTTGIRIDRSGRTSLPSCQLSFGCESMLPGASCGRWTGSFGEGGTDPPEQAANPDELKELLSGIEMELEELPVL